MPPIEIQKIETALIVIAEAIDDGRIDGVAREIKDILGYK